VHRHEKLAPESGVEFRPMAPISSAGFWSVCQAPNVEWLTVQNFTMFINKVCRTVSHCLAL